MTPKQTFIAMVEKWNNAKNYHELKAVKNEYFDAKLQAMFLNKSDEKENERTLTAEDIDRLYRFDHDTMPTREMAEGAEEIMDGDVATLLMPEAVRSEVYMGLENGVWKYSMKNETEGLSSYIRGS